MSRLWRWLVVEWTVVFKALREILWLHNKGWDALAEFMRFTSSSSSLSLSSSSQIGSPTSSSSQLSIPQDIIFCFFLFFWALMLSWPESSLSLSELKRYLFDFWPSAYLYMFWAKPGAGGRRRVTAGVACHPWLGIHIHLWRKLFDNKLPFLIPPYQLYQPALVHSSSKSGTTSYFMIKSNQHVTNIHGLATYSINHSSM